MRILSAVIALSLLAPLPAIARTQQEASAQLRAVTAGQQYRAAAQALEAGHDRWIADIIAITEIPAPPFKEEMRAKAFAEMLRQRGLTEVSIDEEGNVIGVRKGRGEGKALAVTAHLDTVFPEGTAVKVRRNGDRLHAPGVGDDSAGLATILALVDAMNAARVETRRDILFVGTVGEEGLGDLRGVRHLFADGAYEDRIGDFISIDGSGLNGLVTAGTGSKRYRISYKGPGGHSYGAFGIVNPLAALGQTVMDMYRIEVPKKPKTTYSASVVGGGTSVNSIPEEVWLEVDMRSEEAAALDRLEAQFLSIVHRAVAAENRARSTSEGAISAARKKIGDRPAGTTPPDADLVRFAEAAYRAEGIDPASRASSTDSNVPMSLGIPAVTLPGVARGERAHAPDEWIGVGKADNVKLRRVLLATILASAGVR